LVTATNTEKAVPLWRWQCLQLQIAVISGGDFEV
jgi:hypothetical protein